MARIRVRHKASGQTGTLDESEFDPNVFERIGDTAAPVSEDVVAQPQQSLAQKLGQGAIGLGKTLAEPFVETGENIGELARILGIRGLSAVDPQKAAGLAGQPSPFKTEQELQQLSEDPGRAIVEQGVKPGLGVASFAVPFGKGAGVVTKAFIPGAVSGGLFELSQEDASAESVIGASIIGGVSAGIFNKLFGFGDKLDEAGTGLRKSVLNPKVRTEPKFILAQDDLLKVQKKFKLSGSAARQSRQVGVKYVQLADELNNAVKGAKMSFAGDDLVDDALKVIERKVDISKPVAESNFDLWANQIGGEKTAEKLLDLKFALQGEIGNVWKKLQTGRKLTTAEIIAFEFHNVVDDAIKGASPEVKTILADMSLIHKLTPGLFQRTAERVRVPLAGVRVGAGGVQATKDVAGRRLGQAGELIKGALTAGGRVPPEFIGAQVGKGIATKESTKKEIKAQIPKTFNSALKTLDSSLGKVKGGKFLTNEQMIAVELSDLPEKEKKKARKIFDLQEGSANQEKRDVARKNAGVLIAQLEDLYFSGQFAGGRLGGIAKLGQRLVGASPTLQIYIAARDSSRPTLARAFGDVGNLSKAEQEQAVKLLPTEFSTPDEAILGFQQMRIRLGLPAREIGR